MTFTDDVFLKNYSACWFTIGIGFDRLDDFVKDGLPHVRKSGWGLD